MIQEHKWSYIINSFEKLTAVASSVDESWAALNIKGNDLHTHFALISDLHTELSKEGKESLLKIRIDSITSFEELKNDIEHNVTFPSWELNISKLSFIQKGEDDYYENFFVSKSEFCTWTKQLDPLSSANPLNTFDKVKIIVNKFNNFLGGNNLIICDQNQNLNPLPLFDNNQPFPTKEKVSEVIHILDSSSKLLVDPAKYYFNAINEVNETTKNYLKFSIITIIASLAKEVHLDGQILLDGIKRMKLKIYDNSLTKGLTLNFYKEVVQMISWIYEDKTSTRIKLFIDRFTLEIDNKKSITENLITHCSNSLEQAKERYNFVILDRKDQYIKELNSLLKDVKTQSDLHSTKIRNLLSNLLRDALAAIVLIGFTLFTKISDIILLDKNHLLAYIFYSLGIYYIISIVFQSGVDIVDITISKKEMFYWENVTKELIPADDFKRHVNNSLKNRVTSFWITYPVITLIYLLLSICCFSFPHYYKYLIN